MGIEVLGGANSCKYGILITYEINDIEIPNTADDISMK